VVVVLFIYLPLLTLVCTYKYDPTYPAVFKSRSNWIVVVMGFIGPDEDNLEKEKRSG